MVEAPAASAETLILAPLRGDARAIERVVAPNGPVRICETADAVFCSLEADRGRGVLALLLAQEAADAAMGERLARVFQAEPEWSRLPVLFLVADSRRPPPAVRVLESLADAPPFLVLERPARPVVLARAHATQVAQRQRQFETAELMSKLEEAEERQRFLLAELNHRTRNMLAVLQGIFKMTARQSEDVDTLARRFLDRMESIVTAHSALTSEGRQERSLATLLREHADPYCRTPAQLVLSGEDRMVSGKRSFELSMIVHELATNSAKYGALSKATGQVTIAWSGAGESEIDISWTETGGPPVEPPSREGLGTQLIRGGSYGGRIEAELHYDPEGLRWTARLETG